VARPGKSAPGLATALNNLSYPLRAMGRRDEALAAADESVRIYRSLAAARPQKYRHSLACSLGTRAELLSRAGEREQALDATSEAAQIYQDMRPAPRRARGRPARSAPCFRFPSGCVHRRRGGGGWPGLRAGW
jgi:tetratricopeptide (TPR) repeat protein